MADVGTILYSNPSSTSLCDECCSNPWKYRCPGCSIKSCSLPCVKSHKARTSCTGKRNRTEFVPLSQFDDNLLISDYALLEETKMAAESACRMARGFGGYIIRKLPCDLKMLRKAAERRMTKLILLPTGMSKRRTNQSRFDCREHSIYWTIEWRFNATDVVLLDHGVGEHTSLISVIEKHLAPTPLRDQLTPYRNVQINDLKFFLQKTPKKGKKSLYRKLDITAPIGRQLKCAEILEYPVILVFLPSHKYDFEVEKYRMRPLPKKQEPVGSLDVNPSPKGTFFMEEIEEGEVFPDTLVTDLMGHMNSVSNARAGGNMDCIVAEKTGNVSDMRMSKEASNGLNSDSGQNHRSSVVHEAKQNCSSTRITRDYDMQFSRPVAERAEPCYGQHSAASLMEKADMFPTLPVNSWEPPAEASFDFQQELSDAYSDLIGELNPDDFLCLDGGCSFEEFLVEEDLEEGEIPNQ